MACNEQQKEELINRILQINENYTRELVERFVTICCDEKDNIEDVENCATERVRTFYLMTYKSK